MFHTQSQNHLTFPQWDRVYHSGLDFFHHLSVVSLNQTNLGRGLERNHPGELQIMKFFLKAVAEAVEILRLLGILRKAAALCLFH